MATMWLTLISVNALLFHAGSTGIVRFTGRGQTGQKDFTGIEPVSLSGNGGVIITANHGIGIGAICGNLAGQARRAGLMVASCTNGNVVLLVGALYSIPKQSGAALAGGARGAAADVYAE